MNITLTQLMYAVAVEKHQSFRLAAKSCHITQPTLSMQIQKLEDQLGVTLFDRSTQPISVSPIGKSLLSQFRLVLEHTGQIEDMIQNVKGKIQGNIRLGIIPTLAPYVLPLLTRPLLEKYPGLGLQITEAMTPDIIHRLESNQLDIGLLATPLDVASLREIPVFNEPFYVYACTDSPLSLVQEISEEDLSNDRLLLLAEGHCMREQMSQICRLTLKEHKGSNTPMEGNTKQTVLDALQFASGSIETLCHLVLSKIGFTIVPHLAVPWIAGKKDPIHSQKGLIIPFKPPVPIRQVSLVVHRSFAREKILTAFKETIHEVFPQELFKSRPSKLIPLKLEP